MQKTNKKTPFSPAKNLARKPVFSQLSLWTKEPHAQRYEKKWRHSFHPRTGRLLLTESPGEKKIVMGKSTQLR